MPHLSLPNDWLDAVRVICFLVSVYTIVVLMQTWRMGNQDWNVKMKDYWFALTMWTFGGAVFRIQGIVLARPFTPATVLLTTAIFVTAKAALSKQAAWVRDAA